MKQGGTGISEIDKLRMRRRKLEIELKGVESKSFRLNISIQTLTDIISILEHPSTEEKIIV